MDSETPRMIASSNSNPRITLSQNQYSNISRRWLLAGTTWSVSTVTSILLLTDLGLSSDTGVFRNRTHVRNGVSRTQETCCYCSSIARKTSQSKGNIQRLLEGTASFGSVTANHGFQNSFNEKDRSQVGPCRKSLFPLSRTIRRYFAIKSSARLIKMERILKTKRELVALLLEIILIWYALLLPGIRIRSGIFCFPGQMEETW